MPEIIVVADELDESAPVLLRERVTVDNMEFDHYADQLVDRLRWAVQDATTIQDTSESQTRRAA